MEIRLLEYFLAVVQEENLSRAAEVLHVTQPTLSRQMAQLEEELPTDNMRSDGYEIGDIAYWVPGGSLVILYKQNGEHFERQHLGHIASGVEVFETTGDAEVTFELAE